MKTIEQKVQDALALMYPQKEPCPSIDVQEAMALYLGGLPLNEVAQGQNAPPKEHGEGKAGHTVRLIENGYQDGRGRWQPWYLITEEGLFSCYGFYGCLLQTLEHEGKPYVAMKPICEGMDLDWPGQLKLLKRDQVLSSVMVVMTTTGSDGKNYEMMCLPLKYLPGWLFKVDANRYEGRRPRHGDPSGTHSRATLRP